MAAHDEARESLWALFLGPAIWALHFVLSYVTAAIWCAKAEAADFDPPRIAVAGYTVVALLLITLAAYRGFRRHSDGEPAGSCGDRDTPEDRYRFLGLSSLLLCGLSAIATLYAAMTVAFIGSCR